MRKVFVTYKIPEVGLEILREHFEVSVNEKNELLEREEIIGMAKDADALITLLADDIDEKVIDELKNLKIIANYAVGYNNIDVEYAKKKGIMVTNTPDVLTETTADLTWALLMAVSRRIVEADRFVRQERFEGWRPELLLGDDIFGKTLGIIGFGRIGQAVAKRALGFNMKVIYYSRTKKNEELERNLNATFVSLEELLKKSDFITLHTPLTNETYHLIDKKEFKIIKDGAYLINTSRGAVVNERELVKALKCGKLKGAALDVFENEPKITDELLEMKNVVLAPHIGSASIETRERMAVMVAENVLAALNDRLPPNLVPEQRDLFNNSEN